MKLSSLLSQEQQQKLHQKRCDAADKRIEKTLADIGTLRACYYFADAWPVNFWSAFNPARMNEDFSQIIADGFNCIILVVPWRGFQADIEKPKLINRRYLRRLRRILRAARRRNLRVILRMNFSLCHCLDSTLDANDRSEALLYDPQAMAAWCRYLARVSELASRSPAYLMAFISWEDSWETLLDFQNRDIDNRQQLAQACGYTDFLHQLLTDYPHCREELQQDIDTLPVAIPPPGSSEQRLYLQFMNGRVRQQLQLAQTVVPALSLEVRVDSDPFPHQQTTGWHSNEMLEHFSLPRMSYWAPYFLAQNNGETIDADAATRSLQMMLEAVSFGGRNTRHIVNQFNFIDNTPKFKGRNAEIAPAAVSDFLSRAAPLLREKSAGYGLWAYRAYRQNVLYNPGFQFGLEGWRIAQGNTALKKTGGKLWLRLNTGAVVEQHFIPRERGLNWLARLNKLNLCLQTRAAGKRSTKLRLHCSLPGHGDQLVERVVEDPAALSTVLPLLSQHKPRQAMTLRLENRGDAMLISDVCLFDYIYDSQVYDADNQPGSYCDDIRALNAALQTGKNPA